jgi:hypothetical protein
MVVFIITFFSEFSPFPFGIFPFPTLKGEGEKREKEVFLLQSLIRLVVVIYDRRT